MFKISNVEFILLVLIYEQSKITGYQLNSIIEERGHREWADIGTTSIYNGLKKLKQKGYVSSATDRYKKGKGPKGTNFTITPEGLELLKSEVHRGLAGGRGWDRSFDLALSALDVLSVSEVSSALQQRKTGLLQGFEHVQRKYEERSASLPLAGELLFRHFLLLIKNEIIFTEETISQLNTRFDNNRKE